MKLGYAATLTFAAMAVCSAASAAPAARPSDGVLGVLKPDGTFRPTVLHRDGARTSPTAVTGRFILKLKIFVVSALPADTPVQCSLDVTVNGIGAGGELDAVSESVQGTATGTGNVVSCLLTLPYEWHLFADSGGAIEPDSVVLSYGITALNGNVGRVQSVTFDSIGVPDNGKSTVYTEETRI
jgi:hypothetical protein